MSQQVIEFILKERYEDVQEVPEEDFQEEDVELSDEEMVE